MKLRVRLAFATYRKGDLIDVPTLQAQHLLSRRYQGIPLVERVTEVAAAPALVLEPPTAPTPEPDHNPPPPRRKPRSPNP